jgi:mycofactocin precursor
MTPATLTLPAPPVTVDDALLTELPDGELLVESLVEEVSIDGMCGVY